MIIEATVEPQSAEQKEKDAAITAAETGLKPEGFALELIEKHIRGEITNEQHGEMLTQYHKEKYKREK